ncbi:hypothetical protein [Blastococcus goldschmidtiae]|uniref:Nucleotidyltransferase domain-containing protein n=1 Tax=Blastococcus goldschmidtiae TaxID=3075546 RepID=A0ABU2K4G9_9ACTN|nr:hypothetical protein [Blastococcus sp. DSM 46792]MDT0275106.1 hypothetical protein [Blastococcus sp. DSM 46792]
MRPWEPGRLSSAQTDLLAWLFLHSGQEFALVELAVDVGMPTSAAGAELQPMVAADLVSLRPTDAGDVYRANMAHIAAGELARSFMATHGPVRVVREEFAAVAETDVVVLFGEWAGGPSGRYPSSPSDVDLLIVGAPSPVAVAAAAERAERRLDLPVNTVVRTSQQWALGADPLVAEVRRSGYVTVRPAGRCGSTSGQGGSTSIAT